MKAWRFIVCGLSLAIWAGHEFGNWPATVVIGPLLLALMITSIFGVLWWRRLRAIRSVVGIAWAFTAAASFWAFAFLERCDVISLTTFDRWFAPGFAAYLVSLVGGAILLALDRIDHPRRWKLVKEQIKSCGFVDSLLFRDIPDIPDHEDLYF